MTTPLDRYAQRQARTKRLAESVSYVNGMTTEVPADGWVRVDIGGAIRKARVPGSFRANVQADQQVRLSRQQNTLVVDSILSALPTPAVAALPSAASTVSVSPLNMTATPGFGSAGYSNAGFTTQDWEIINYVEQIILNDLNDHRDVLNNHSTQISALEALSAAVTKLNQALTTLGDIRQLLIDQGNAATP